MAASHDDKLKTLLEGCRQGIRESQKELYNSLYGYAMAICLRYAKRTDDAKEILNDGFLKVFNGLPGFSNPPEESRLESSFKSWVKKIMVYTAIDHFRVEEKHARHLDISEEAYHLSDQQPHPLDHLAYEELIKMIQDLSPGYRIVFNLFVIEGFSHEEISRLLGISTGASKSNLAKARENLRKMLKKTHEAVFAKYDR